MITTSTTNEVKEIMKCEIEWLDIKKNEFYFFMDYLVTDGDNIEIKCLMEMIGIAGQRETAT